MIQRTGVVLIGGEGRRMGGREKYSILHEGRTFLDHLLDTLRETTDEVIVVSRDSEQRARCEAVTGARCITDIRRGIGPIGGIHAASRSARGELLCVVACDMPCISPAVIEYLFSRCEGYDAAVPCWNREMLEPLHAIYRREAVVQALETDPSLSLRGMISRFHTRYIPIGEIRRFDPVLHTFTNINHPHDLERFTNR
ncbi:MAG: molybdenum cofactor guanylyltransferase [Methanomicrobiales archaeon]